MHLSQDIIDLLNEKYLLYNRPAFIETDPVSIPHLFTRKEDIEISGFLTAIIAWGARPMILSNAHKLMQMMENEPYDFIINSSDNDLKAVEKFYHRTLNGTDCVFLCKALKNIYLFHGGIETIFSANTDLKTTISHVKSIFLQTEHLARSEKHLADPMKGAAAKRILMFLRWMVRDDGKGIDFGIWKNINPAQLYVPLDIHTGNTARNLGLLKRNQNDWRAVEELTSVLRMLDPADPVKYDFALFGVGNFEGRTGRSRNFSK